MSCLSQGLLTVAALTIAIAGCAGESLETQHEKRSDAYETALVESTRLANGDIATRVLDLTGREEIATLAWVAGNDSAKLTFAGGSTYSYEHQLEEGVGLLVWNDAAYSVFMLDLWAENGGEGGEAYCHENAAGVGCRGACGPGCKKSCPISYVCQKNSSQCGGAGNGLRWFRVYNCYKRPCCVTHDACYDACDAPPNGKLCRRKCDAQALVNGCGTGDAAGTTGGKADATPAKFYHPTQWGCGTEGATADKLPDDKKPYEEQPSTDPPKEDDPAGDAAEEAEGEAFADAAADMPEPERGNVDWEPTQEYCAPGECAPTAADPDADGVFENPLEWMRELGVCPEDGACLSGILDS